MKIGTLTEVIEKIKNEPCYTNDKDGGIHQAIMNVFYAGWDYTENTPYNYYSEMIFVAHTYDPRFALLIMIGKYNQQVCNGGHTQFFDNGYADVDGGGFFSDHTNADLFHFLNELVDEYLFDEKFKEIKDCINEAWDKVTQLTEDCDCCDGSGYVYNEEEVECECNGEDEDCCDCYGNGTYMEETTETCEVCNGDGYKETENMGIERYDADDLDTKYYAIKNAEELYEGFAKETMNNIEIDNVVNEFIKEV